MFILYTVVGIRYSVMCGNYVSHGWLHSNPPSVSVYWCSVVLCVTYRKDVSFLILTKTPIECLYLELGVIPLRFHLMMKRILYLHTIMQRSDDELTKQVVLCQKAENRKGDFYTQTKENMEYLSISESDMEESRNKIKEVLNKNTKLKAFQFLIEKAKTHSKVNEKL